MLTGKQRETLRCVSLSLYLISNLSEQIKMMSNIWEYHYNVGVEIDTGNKVGKKEGTKCITQNEYTGPCYFQIVGLIKKH